MSSKTKRNDLDGPRFELMLWSGFFLGPFAWLVDLALIYRLSNHGCSTQNLFPNHIVSALLLIVALVGGFIAWTNWKRTARTGRDEDAIPLVRSGFLAILGVLSSALFVLLIFAQWLPTVLGVPCGT